jgi:ankyrin repeat protein
MAANYELIAEIVQRVNSEEALKLLLSCKVTVEQMDQLFHTACDLGATMVVMSFVENGYDIRRKNNLALQLVCERGYYDLAAYLLVKGADLHANQDQVFRHACCLGNLNIVKLLISFGANIYAKNCHGMYLAIMYNRQNVVQFLNEI